MTPKRTPVFVQKYLVPDWQAKSEEDLTEMSENHNKLINFILSEEEELITAHREHVDTMVGVIKQEMSILHVVDQPGSDVEDYIQGLQGLLSQKLRKIREVQERLEVFTSHLKAEEEVSKKFYILQSEVVD